MSCRSAALRNMFLLGTANELRADSACSLSQVFYNTPPSIPFFFCQHTVRQSATCDKAKLGNAGWESSLDFAQIISHNRL